MKAKIFGFLTLIALCLYVSQFLLIKITKAADTDTVTATITAVIYSVSLDQSAIPFGAVSQGSSQSTTVIGLGTSPDYTVTATNNGSVTEQVQIKAANSTGGVGWTLATSTGSETYALNFCKTDCDGSPTWNTVGINPSYVTLAASVAKDATQVFDLQIKTPTSTVVTAEQSITVTILATAL